MSMRVNRPGGGPKARMGDDLAAMRGGEAAGERNGVAGDHKVDIGDGPLEKGIPHGAAGHIRLQAKPRGVLGHPEDGRALFGAGAVEQTRRVHKSGL